MDIKIMQITQDKLCPKCVNHKPKSKNDCSIYVAVFKNKSPMAMSNLDKLFDNGLCKGYTEKQDVV